LTPADRVVVDWRISEYELVDDDEASQFYKPVVLFILNFLQLYFLRLSRQLHW